MQCIKCFQVNIYGCTQRLRNVMPPKASVDALKCNAPELSKNNVTTMQQLTTYVQFTLLHCLQSKMRKVSKLLKDIESEYFAI